MGELDGITFTSGSTVRGWDVDVIEAYRTVAILLTDAQRAAAARADAITFTSSSTVTNYLDAAGPVPPTIVCIGPVTADVARNAGFTVPVIARDHTAAALAAAIHDYLVKEVA